MITKCPGGLQVASLQQDYPALVATFYMSYIQQDPDVPQPLPGSSPEPKPSSCCRQALQALPSTGASVDVAADGAERPAVSVPRIVFLYKLAAGVADKSFGEHACPLREGERGRESHYMMPANKGWLDVLGV